MRPDLTSTDFVRLREDLALWLSKIVARHGAEAALMLYPEDRRAHRLFEEIDQLGTGFLPQREGCSGEIREEALRSFVRHPTPEQRTLLANRLNTAFYLTVLTLDPAAKKLAQEDTKGTRIYCDTNFLYAVLGVASAEEVLAAHRLLELTSALGCQVAVTPWTVAELDMSIRHDRREVAGYGVRPGLARLMVEVTGEKGFAHAYWRAVLEDSDLRPEDYFDRLSHFEFELPRWGIEIVDEGCKAIDDNVEAVRDYSSLLERILGVATRHRDVVEHDAKHRLLVERLRGAGNIRFSNARYWFLTQDHKLPLFAAMMPDAGDAAPDLPFCISPSTWLQVVRALTPRTENFDQMVVELLGSPYVGYRGPVNQQAVRRVVARMDQYDGASREHALAVS